MVQRQLLEVAKSLAADPAVLILDEPTASLGADETAVLFTELRRLAGGGTAVVYITHRLAEVRELCQRVTVLRDGTVRGSFRVSDVSDARLLELIVGRAVTTEFPAKAGQVADERPVLSVKHLSDRAFHDITIAAWPGEILGLAGIVGNGQSEEELRTAGEELSRRVVQQYVYQRLTQEMQARGYNVVEETTDANQAIHMRIRHWEN